MPPTVAEVVGAYRLEIPTGSVTTLAAAAQMFSARHTSATLATRLKRLEVEFLLTTAFGAPQEVGFDVKLARAYTVSPTGQTAVTVGGDGRKRSSYGNASIGGGDVRVSTAGAIAAGTLTLDTNPIARGSFWAGAIGAQMAWRQFDFSLYEPGGIILVANEGLIIENGILMGATGVGRWVFTLDFEDVILAN